MYRRQHEINPKPIVLNGSFYEKYECCRWRSHALSAMAVKFLEDHSAIMKLSKKNKVAAAPLHALFPMQARKAQPVTKKWPTKTGTPGSHSLHSVLIYRSSFLPTGPCIIVNYIFYLFTDNCSNGLVLLLTANCVDWLLQNARRENLVQVSQSCQSTARHL